MPSSFPVARTACVAFLLIIFADTAQARPALSPYVGVAVDRPDTGRLEAAGSDSSLGPFAVSEKVKPGWLGSAVLGAQIAGTPVAVEAEGLYVRNGVSTPDLDQAFGAQLNMKSRTKAALFNLKLAAPQPIAIGALALRPYAAVGIGYGDSAVTILGDDYKGRGLTWQGKGGVELKASERLTLNLGYRYLRLPSFHTNQLGLDAKLKTHVQGISIGATWALAPR